MKEYKRLTDKTKAELLLDCHDCPYCGVEYLYDCHIKVSNRLAELEDKIEQGLMFEMPCKVGDKVWVLDRNNKLIKMEIVEYSLSETLKRYYAVSVLEGYGYWLYESELNEDWFLTKAEAEAKLKELKGEV